MSPHHEDDEDDFTPEDTLSFMGGDCWLLAAALHEVTGLPIFGAQDKDGLVHHAFVMDEPRGFAIDYHGVQSLSEFVARGGERAVKLVPLTERELAWCAVEGVKPWLTEAEQSERAAPRSVSHAYGDEEWEYALEVADEIADDIAEESDSTRPNSEPEEPVDRFKGVDDPRFGLWRRRARQDSERCVADRQAHGRSDMGEDLRCSKAVAVTCIADGGLCRAHAVYHLGARGIREAQARTAAREAEQKARHDAWLAERAARRASQQPGGEPNPPRSLYDEARDAAESIIEHADLMAAEHLAGLPFSYLDLRQAATEIAEIAADVAERARLYSSALISVGRGQGRTSDVASARASLHEAEEALRGSANAFLRRLGPPPVDIEKKPKMTEFDAPRGDERVPVPVTGFMPCGLRKRRRSGPSANPGRSHGLVIARVDDGFAVVLVNEALLDMDPEELWSSPSTGLGYAVVSPFGSILRHVAREGFEDALLHAALTVGSGNTALLSAASAEGERIVETIALRDDMDVEDVVDHLMRNGEAWLERGPEA